MPAPTDRTVTLSPEAEMQRFVSLPQAAELRNISVDALVRNFADRIVAVSPGRKAMRLGDALRE
jgi:hypothetical protein